ncbi:MAG TPA: DUF4199 domain-containing protein [Pyrinomonadaceae bacterium]|jgi:hypothetical protein
MKRAFKYGLLVTLIIVLWVALKHFVLHIDPARAAVFDTIIFNVAGILGLSLGIRDRKGANGGSLTFGEGVKTGFSIAVTYAVLTSIYFATLLLMIGPKLMQQAGETGPGNEVTALVVAKAFAGVLVGLTLIGTILSVIISMVLRKRPA